MIGRDRRYGRGRRANLRARLGIATAVLVGGGAIGVAAVAATSHSAPTTARSAGFSQHWSRQPSSTVSQGAALSSALSDWNSSQQQSLSTLSRMAPVRTFSEVTRHHTEFAVQRGIVVLVTKKFVILRSSNGNLHLWWLSGNTRVKDVSGSRSGTGLRRGDLALIAGAREHGYLHAELVLFAPLTATKPSTTPSTSPSTTPSTPASPVPASTMKPGTHT